jgi:hypothetical protein
MRLDAFRIDGSTRQQRAGASAQKLATLHRGRLLCLERFKRMEFLLRENGLTVLLV